MEIIEKRRLNYSIINLPKEVDDSTIEYLESILKNLANLDQHKLIFNLKDVRIITSRGIGLILWVLTLVQRQGSKLKLCIDIKNKTITMILHSIHMEKYIDYYSEIEDAISEQNKVDYFDI